jgi:phosphoserine phosphatase RsbU/P
VLYWRDPVHARLRILSEWLGRVGIAFLILLVLYVATDSIAPQSPARIALLIALIATGVWTGIRVARRGMRHAIWRLRNRLLVTYLFIAVVPIALILGLAALSGSSLVSQFAMYLVTNEMDRRIAALGRTAETISEIRPDRRADLIPRLAELLRRAADPEIQVTLRDGAIQYRFPNSNAAPEPLDGWETVQGVLIREARPYFWAHLKTATGEVTVAQPLTREYLSGLAPKLGIVDFATKQGRLLTRAAIGVPIPTLPPATNRFDREIVSIASVPWMDWNRPGETVGDPQAYVIAIRTRFSMVLAALFSQATDIGQLNWRIWLAIGLSVFIIVEIISLIAGVGMTRTITGAVHRLYEGTHKVTEGDFSHRIEVRGNDQLAELSHSFNRMTENIERLLVVSKEKERLQSEIEIAREVQSQLFPREVPRAKTLRLTAICNPARLVSGDYYDYAQVSESHVALALGDVAGKGISAALLMASLQSSLRSYLQGSLETAAAVGSAGGTSLSTSNLISRLNRQLYANTSPEKYATFFLGMYDDTTSTLTYTNAGHLPPLVVRRGQPIRLDVNGTVVGAFSFAKYDESRIVLEPGDLLLCFTDGISEPENHFGEMFGEDRLTDLMVRNADRSDDEIARAIAAAVTDWTGSDELQDDMTLLLARRL